MSASNKNFLVGLTVLLAIGIFGWMILRFGAKSVGIFAPSEEAVEIDAPRVDGLSEGSPLTYQGVSVGRVTKLQRNADGTGVTMRALLQTNPPVPTNVKAEIVTTNLIGGGTSVALELPMDPQTGKEQPPHMPAPGQHYPPIHAAYIGLKLNIFPSQYGNVAEQISRAASAIADASVEIRQRKLVEHLDDAVQNITRQSTRAGDMIQSIQNLIGDPSVRGDLRQTITNARKASTDLAQFSADLPHLSQQASGVMTNANTMIQHTQDRLDDASKELADALARASTLLDSVHSITQKIDKGQGSAGLLVNDPKLYQSLVDASRQLNDNLSDLQRILQQWEQEGVSLKLK